MFWVRFLNWELVDLGVGSCGDLRNVCFHFTASQQWSSSGFMWCPYYRIFTRGKCEAGKNKSSCKLAVENFANVACWFWATLASGYWCIIYLSKPRQCCLSKLLDNSAPYCGTMIPPTSASCRWGFSLAFQLRRHKPRTLKTKTLTLLALKHQRS